MSKAPSELAHEMAQECLSKAPVVILGSGASAAHGIPGMPGLREHLLNMGPPTESGPEDVTAWETFIQRLKTTDLESALSNVQLSNKLTQHIIETTWDYLVPHDLCVFEKLVRNRRALALTRLYQHFFKSTHTEINVITPNYDRLAEYAADAGEICHFTGFGYGHIRLRAKPGVLCIHQGRNKARTVNVWKVHGSIDWFRDADGVVMGLPITDRRPKDLQPVLVTPGVEKYRLTHDEPFRSIMQGADSAMQSARGFLCIGYGFNDKHLQPMLVERCRTESIPLVLITRSISPSAKDFLHSGKCQRYLALEQGEAGYRMFSTNYPNGMEVDGAPFWQLDQFLTMVT